MTISLSLSSYSNSCGSPVESYKPTIKKPIDLWLSHNPAVWALRKPTLESQLTVHSSTFTLQLTSFARLAGRPGVGADLHGCYGKLKLNSGAKSDEGSQLPEQVEAYKSEYKELSDWLGEEKAVMVSFTPPTITLEEFKTQLQQVKVSGNM